MTMGGSDPDNATALVLGALERLSRRFDVTVVVGGANPRLDSIRQQCLRLTRVCSHNTANFESLMAKTDMAIAAVGGTIWELAYMGVPTLLLSATDLHHRVAGSPTVTARIDGWPRWMPRTSRNSGTLWSPWPTILEHEAR